MFVTFYDKKNKERLAVMEEMSFVPCIDDKMFINNAMYVVIERVFALEKKNRCACYVRREYKE